MAWSGRPVPRTLRSAGLALSLAVAAVGATVPAGVAATAPGAGPVIFPHGRDRSLTWASSGRCAGSFRIGGTSYCTHGPDARGPLRPESMPQPSGRSARLAGSGPSTAVTCDGDGTSGDRIQAIYARASSAPDRYASVLAELRSDAALVQDAFLLSAAETGGLRRPRWVTDSSCHLDVDKVVLSNAAANDFGATITELQNKGYTRSDRKYLIWFDANVYCGIGTWWGDERPTPDNLSNQTAGYARSDTSCWGWAESHEIMHTLGAVNDSAPHSTSLQTGGGHCSDEYDVMCYPDAAGTTMTVLCPSSGHDVLFDCDHDDYFDTDPPDGSYLATHWDSAASAWLAHTSVNLRAPYLRLKANDTLDSSGVPVSVLFASSAPVVGLETVGLAAKRDAGSWQTVTGVPDGATQVGLHLPSGHAHRFRVRATGDDGSPTGWMTGAVATPSLRQESHASLTWKGIWKKAAGGSASGGSTRWSSKSGATATFTTSATDVALVAPRGPDHGRAQVWVDGVRVATIDLYASSAQPRRTVFVRHFGSAGSHTVRLKVLGTHSAASTGNRVDLDAIALLAP